MLLRLRGFRLVQEPLEEGRGVRDGHGAVERDGQQLVRGHGESVSVDAVTQGAEREIQEVQFSLRQTLPQHIFVSKRTQFGSARGTARSSGSSWQWLRVTAAVLKICNVGIQGCRSRVVILVSVSEGGVVFRNHQAASEVT